MFLSEWREFPSAPCLAGGKKIWWQLASRCCWNSACRLICFLSAYVTRKDFQFVTWTPLSKDTIYSALRHREVSRAKDLSAPPLVLSVNFCVQVKFKVMSVETAYFLYVLCSKLEQLCHTPNSNISTFTLTYVAVPSDTRPTLKSFKPNSSYCLQTPYFLSQIIVLFLRCLPKKILEL